MIRGKYFKVRKFRNGMSKTGEPFINYSLTLPSHIAEELPADQHYACELTKEGILFRPTLDTNEKIALPQWAKTSGTKMSDEATKSEARKKTSRNRPKRVKKAA